MSAEAEIARNAPKVGVAELFSPLYLERTFLSILLMVALQFNGAPAVFFYSTVIFEQAGLSRETSSYITILLGVLNIVQTVISGKLTETMLGRRSLQLIGLTGQLISLVGLFISMSITVR